MDNKSVLDSARNAIDARIKDLMNRPTLAEDLQKQNEKQVVQKHSWMEEIRQDKASYIFAAISATFTFILGLILGLAPYPDIINNAPGVSFHTDFLHVFVGVMYGATFVAVTEGAFLLAKNKHHTREEGNFAQQASMVFMIILSFISILGTGLAGARIGASVLGFLSDFKEIPHSTQTYVVSIIPVLFAVYLLCLMIFRNSSQRAKNKRLAENAERKLQEDHDLRMRLVELDEEEQLQVAEIEAYKKAVADGRITAADALAARRAKKTLRQLESERQQDLNGDGHIESPAPRTVSIPEDVYKQLLQDANIPYPVESGTNGNKPGFTNRR